MDYVSISEPRKEFNLIQVLNEYVWATYIFATSALFLTVPCAYRVTGVHPWAMLRNSTIFGLYDQNEGYIQVTAVTVSAATRKVQAVQAVIKVRQAWLSFKWVIFSTMTLKM